MHDFLFYSDDIDLKNKRLILKGDEFKHAFKILRKKVGDTLTVFDGLGMRYKVLVNKIEKNRAICSVTDIFTCNEVYPELQVGVGLLKSKAMVEVIKDCSALGISEILLFRSKNSVVKEVNLERLKKISIESVKQSNGFRIPAIKYMDRFDACLKEMSEDGLKLIADMDGEIAISSIFDKDGLPEKVCILFGPEGGFTKEEIEKAKDFGFETVKLTDRRLRTELAIITAVSYILYSYY